MILAPIQDINYWLHTSLYVIYFITIIGTIVVIISENRNPVKSIAWIVVLIFLPIAGLIFYIFFGQEHRRQRMISRKGKRKLLKNSHYTEDTIHDLPVGLSDETRQEIKLGYALGKFILYPDNKVSVFTTGEQKIEMLKARMKEAKKFIHLQYYIFNDDKLGNEIKQILTDKVQEGVEVRILYDDVGCWKVKKRFFDELAAAGIEVRPFLEVRFPQLTNKINYRNHRKIAIIDGVAGFIGGMNIADRYRDGLSWGVWRDTHMLIEGPAVQGLQSSFAVDWSFTSRQLLSEKSYFPDIPPMGNTHIQIITSGPIGEWKEISLSFLKALSNAKQYIYIQTPYFLPTESLMTTLQVAALAKVDVRLMLPEKSDSRVMQWATNSYIKPMLKAGVKIYFYQKGFLHAKTIVIDDEFATTGSTNLDFRSFDHNFEINAFMYDRELAVKMKQIFIADQQHCRRIPWSYWRKRSATIRIKESVARLLSPLL
ncbi:MAG: cardiolipin synthase [Coprobacter sp.]|nr:cardiolipin synthase [Coprobacter sp.]